MKTLKLTLCKLLLFLFAFNSYAQQHPFLIVKENQYSELRQKYASNKQPFKFIGNKAFERWNNSFTPDNFGSLNASLNYNILAYILEANSSNRIKYKNKIFEVLKAWERGADFLNGSHGRFTGGGSVQFNAIIALDIIYNDLTPSEIAIAEKGIIKANNFYNNNSSAWTLVDYGVKLVYAIYKNDTNEITKWKTTYDNYLFDKSMMNDGSWGQSSGYVFARMHGGRLAKNFPIDVMHFVGLGNYYNDSRMKALFEWSNTFAVTPAGSYTKFGDTGHNSYQLKKNSNWHFAEQYGTDIGAIAQWNMGPNNFTPTFVHFNYLIFLLRDINVPAPTMPTSKLREHSGAALWDRTNSREALQGVLHCLKRDNPAVNQFGHTLEESNTFSLSAYGQHMIMNSGVNYVGLNGQGGNYPGYAPDNGRWSRAILHNTVLIGNKTNHDQRDGNGLIDGLVGGNIEFGTTDAGQAIKNGTHKRTLSLIHPVAGKSYGYFAIHDEVKPNKPSDKVTINFQVNTKRGGTNTIKTNQEYAAPITAAVYKDFNSHNATEKVNLFFASGPQVAIVDSYKGGFDITDVKSDNVRAQYNTGSDGVVRATTIVFPEDGTHKKPSITKIANSNYSGAKVSHSNTFIDHYIGASPTQENTYAAIRFKANSTFYRKESGKTTLYSSTNGTKFLDTDGVDQGFTSSKPVSIVIEDKKGSVNAKNTTNITFYKLNISGVKVNGNNVSVISSASNTITVAIPAGRHKIELITDGNSSTRPGANIANGDYYIEAPISGFRIKNTNGAVVSISAGSGNDAKWTFTKIGGSNYTIKNVKTGRFLEVPYGPCVKNEKPQNPNLNLGTYTQVVADHLRWNITKVGNDYFLEPLHCAKVVDRNNGNTMHLWPYQAGNTNQNWKIQSVNKSPEVSFKQPTPNTTFTEGDNLTVEANAHDQDGSIVKVDLYFDGKFVKKSPQSGVHIWWSKYDVLMTNLTAGEHTLKLVAEDNLGAITEATKGINVKAKNIAPTVSFIRPTETVFDIGDNLTVEAKANDIDGSIKKVDLYFDGKFVKKSPQSGVHIWWSKYDVLMTNLQEGEHTLRLVATDNLELTAEATMKIVVRGADCQWILQQGKANDIGANKSHIYHVGTNGYLYKYNGNGGWTNTDRTKKIKRLDVDINGDVWAIGQDNKLWQYKYPNGPWLDKNGTGIDIGVAQNVYYILGMDNRIRKYTGNGTYSLLSSGRGKRIDVDGNGNPWVVGMNNGLYQWVGNGFSRKGSLSIADVSIQPNGNKVLVTGTNQKIYSYAGNGVYNELPGLATQITMNSDEIPWVINSAKNIYKRGCIAGQRIPLDTEKGINGKYQIRVYPNPITGSDFTIDLNTTETSYIRIFDAIGRKVYETKTNSGSIQLQKRILKNAGLYFIKVVQNKSSFVEKILLK